MSAGNRKRRGDLMTTKTKATHTPEQVPIIDPYVTDRGGVVIFNGPFPLDQAEKVRALCAAAPQLLRGCQAAIAYLTDPASEFESNRKEAERIIWCAIQAAE